MPILVESFELGGRVLLGENWEGAIKVNNLSHMEKARECTIIYKQSGAGHLLPGSVTRACDQVGQKSDWMLDGLSRVGLVGAITGSPSPSRELIQVALA